MNVRMKRRLFIALPIDESAKIEIKKNLRDLPGKKVAPENWHFTLEFLGDVPEEKLEILFNIVNSLPLPNSIPITFTRMGAFPRSRSARIIWAGISEGEKELEALSKILREMLQNNHFVTEERPFVAHLTVSRIYRPENISRWLEKQPFHKVKTILNSIILYQSILEEHGARYEILLERSF